jgi:Fe-S-cluster containining protein
MTEHEFDARALVSSRPLLKELARLYAGIPAMTCDRRGLCCGLLPEMSFPEYMGVLEAAQGLDPERTHSLAAGLVRYFFINPVRLSPCPFLYNGACLVYRNRPLGCRMYGLWSREKYAARSLDNRQAKYSVQAAWRKLGVRLPPEVVNFSLPYCDRVRLEADVLITDDRLDSLDESVAELARGAKWESVFRERYFSDPSFAAASAVVGYGRALTLKVSIVREMIDRGASRTLDSVLALLTPQTIRTIFPPKE